MTRLGKCLAAVTCFLLLFPAMGNANLVSNGSFAGGSGAGWTFNYAPTNQPPVPPFNCGINCGFQSIVVDGRNVWYDPWDLCQCTISQDLATTPGQTYLVRYLFGMQVHTESPGRFNSWFDGAAGQTAAGPFIGPGITPAPWQTQEISFLRTATDASSTLEFGGLCPGCNFFVADVSVIAVPLPDTLPLVAVGLGIAAYVTHRKRSQAVGR